MLQWKIEYTDKAGQLIRRFGYTMEDLRVAISIMHEFDWPFSLYFRDANRGWAFIQ